MPYASDEEVKHIQADLKEKQPDLPFRHGSIDDEAGLGIGRQRPWAAVSILDQRLWEGGYADTHTARVVFPE